MTRSEKQRITITVFIETNYSLGHGLCVEALRSRPIYLSVCLSVVIDDIVLLKIHFKICTLH